MLSGRAESLIVVDAPQSCTGDPAPRIFAGDREVFFAYRLAPSETGGEGGEAVCAVVSALHPTAITFGPPNDEALQGHRLYSKGLRHYASYEVENSAWIAEMEVRNRVHPYHRKERFEGLHHYIFTFHDSTLELVAEGLDWTIIHGTPVEALWAKVGGPGRGMV